MALAAAAALAAGGILTLAASAPGTAPRPHHAARSRQVRHFGNPRGHADIPRGAAEVTTSSPDHVVGTGSPASCTSAAVVSAVASGGVITFNCGRSPVTILMTATAKVVNTSQRVVLDGGGKVTLSGGGRRQILYLDTCDRRQKITAPDCYNQEWPQLIVQNMTFIDGNAPARQARGAIFGGGGGGAIFDVGGQLRVVNSQFIGNLCFHAGPDLGGGAIRALAQWNGSPVYITNDTFHGNGCSNGGALSSIGVSWVVLNSVMTDNLAAGYGANPAAPGTPGGGSGGAIYTDGDNYSVLIRGSIISGNRAREGGGAIFFVSNNNTGTLTIQSSKLHSNENDAFWTRPYPGIYFHSSGLPKVISSAVN